MVSVNFPERERRARRTGTKSAPFDASHKAAFIYYLLLFLLLLTVSSLCVYMCNDTSLPSHTIQFTHSPLLCFLLSTASSHAHRRSQYEGHYPGKHGSAAAPAGPRGGAAAGGEEEGRGVGAGAGGTGSLQTGGGGDGEGAGDQGRRSRAGGPDAGPAAAAAPRRAGHAVGVAAGHGEAWGRGRRGEAEVLPQHGVRDPDAQGGAPRCALQGAQLRHLQVGFDNRLLN